MAILQWDQSGEHLFETGVDHGVLYIPDSGGAYSDGVAWNGLVNATESPSGAEANAQYADNIKYLNLYSAEEFGLTIEAFTYPDEFLGFDGFAVPSPGVTVGQQGRKVFGLSYRTLIGNDLDGNEHGFKLHLVYGCQASPSERAYATVSDSPEPITFSWEVATTPIPVAGYPLLKPTSLVVIDSTKVAPSALTILMNMLYGTVGTDPHLPLPGEVLDIFDGTITLATPTKPTFDNVDTITIPTVTGVSYYDNGVLVPAGAYTILDDTVIEARPNSGYYFSDTVDTDWLFVFAG